MVNKQAKDPVSNKLNLAGEKLADVLMMTNARKFLTDGEFIEVILLRARLSELCASRTNRLLTAQEVLES